MLRRVLACFLLLICLQRHLHTDFSQLSPVNAPTLPPTGVVCGSQCTDVSSDPLRCGRCHTKCFAPLSKMAYCNNGVCKTTSGLNSCPDGSE